MSNYLVSTRKLFKLFGIHYLRLNLNFLRWFKYACDVSVCVVRVCDLVILPFLICRYREAAKTLSERFQDRPLSAIDTAVYWTEYVIRHKGAPHLRSAGADLPLYKYLLLDVIAICLLLFIICVYLLYFVLYRIIFVPVKFFFRYFRSDEKEKTI